MEQGQVFVDKMKALNDLPEIKSDRCIANFYQSVLTSASVFPWFSSNIKEGLVSDLSRRWKKKKNHGVLNTTTSCLGGPCILWLFPFSAIVLAHCKLRVQWKAEQANIYHFFKMRTQRNASRSPLDAFFEDRWVVSSWRPGSHSQRSQLQHSKSNSRPCFSNEVCWAVAQRDAQRELQLGGLGKLQPRGTVI